MTPAAEVPHLASSSRYGTGIACEDSASGESRWRRRVAGIPLLPRKLRVTEGASIILRALAVVFALVWRVQASAPMRLLVAGDKSHAGKTTVSLGLLSALLDAGFKPQEIAYIKPATQCVSSTITARFCESMGIACEHIGPVVFYRGFTRQYLDGTDPDANDQTLVERCAAAVERIERGDAASGASRKKLTIIDGVGYPSVGSIVGCSSADLAVACRAPVLIVGRPGLGDAIDSFNLCARYFEGQRVPVLGCVFNKVAFDGFYGANKIKPYMVKYMQTSRPSQHVYGLLPQNERLAKLADEETCGINFKRPESSAAGSLTDADRQIVTVIAAAFKEHVDVQALLKDLERALECPAEFVPTPKTFPM